MLELYSYLGLFISQFLRILHIKKSNFYFIDYIFSNIFVNKVQIYKNGKVISIIIIILL